MPYLKKLGSLLFAAFSALAAGAALLCFIGFEENLWLARTVDVPLPVIDFGWRLLIDLGLIVLFGLQHSVMARPAFKRLWMRVVPPHLVRSTYLLATAGALGLLVLSWQPLPGQIWQVRGGWLEMLLLNASLAGWAITLISAHLIDPFELFGLRQAWDGAQERAAKPIFRTPLFYRWVRHPMYTGMLLALWATPVMTLGHLLLSAGLSVYLAIGIRHEERDLLWTFGESYARYRLKVSAIIPGWRLINKPRAEPKAQAKAAPLPVDL